MKKSFHMAFCKVFLTGTVAALICIASGCESGRNREPGEGPEENRSVRIPNSEGAKTEPIDKVVKPREVKIVDRDEIRLFELRAGDAFELQRGGIIVLKSTLPKEIIFRRDSDMHVSNELGLEYPVGNREYMIIKKVDLGQTPPVVLLELRTANRPWWDWSF